MTNNQILWKAKLLSIYFSYHFFLDPIKDYVI